MPRTTRLSSSHPVAVLGAAALLALAPSARAQVKPLVTAEVNPAQLVALGPVSAAPRAGVTDLGVAPANVQTQHGFVVLKRSAEQDANLEDLLAAQQTKSSSVYHKWLTPQQFGEQFGAADADIEAVRGWLTSQGIAVTRVTAGRNALEISATVGQLEQAFHTQVHQYAVGDAKVYAAAGAMQIPAALAPVVAGITSLAGAIPAGTQARSTVRASLNPQTRTIQPDYNYPTPGGVNSYAYLLSPADFKTQYNGTSVTQTGTGISIGFIGDSNIDPSVLASYRSTFGLAAVTPTVVVDGNDPGQLTDNTAGNYSTSYNLLAQMEVAAMAAPAAAQYLYVSKDTEMDSGMTLAIARAVEDNKVNILSVGYNLCEPTSSGINANAFFQAVWQQAAAQGISVLVSTGDSGSAACDSDAIADATHGLAVNGVASTPYNTAVGGTDFYYPAGDTPSSHWNATSGTSNGNGIGSQPYASLKAPISEQAWNASDTSTDQVKPPNGAAAGGGGVSTVYAKPGWQNVGSASYRQLPDVSMFAGNNYNYSMYAVCTDATECVGGSPNSPTNPTPVEGASGTSMSTAAFAGVLALVAQKQGGSLGLVNPALYGLGIANSAFKDVTTGTNAVSCAPGSPNCGSSGFMANSNGPAYRAAVGYDLATGLGSVNIANLIANFKEGTNKPNITLTVSAGTITHGQAVTLTARVGGLFNHPGGDVSFLSSTTLPGQSGLGIATLTGALFGNLATLSTNNLPGGTYTITAHYAGDGTSFAANTSSPVSITVNPEPSYLFQLQSSVPNGSTVPQGTTVIVEVGPYALNSTSTTPPTGTITPVLNGVPQTAYATPLNSFGYASISSSQLPVGTASITFSYSGDASYQPSVSTVPFVVTVAAAPGGGSGPAASTPTFTASTPTSGSSLAAGASSVANVALASVNNFNGDVLVSCKTPAGFENGSCTPTPARLTLAAGSTAQVSVAISTGASSGTSAASGGWKGWTGGGVAVASLLLLTLPARRRGWRGMLGNSTLALLLAAGFSLGLGGCSSPGAAPAATSGGSTQVPHVAAGTYVLHVVLTQASPSSGQAAITQDVPITVNVQ